MNGYDPKARRKEALATLRGATRRNATFRCTKCPGVFVFHADTGVDPVLDLERARTRHRVRHWRGETGEHCTCEEHNFDARCLAISEIDPACDGELFGAEFDAGNMAEELVDSRAREAARRAP